MPRLDLADRTHRAIAASVLAERIHLSLSVCEDRSHNVARQALDDLERRLALLDDPTNPPG